MLPLYLWKTEYAICSPQKHIVKKVTILAKSKKKQKWNSSKESASYVDRVQKKKTNKLSIWLCSLSLVFNSILQVLSLSLPEFQWKTKAKNNGDQTKWTTKMCTLCLQMFYLLWVRKLSMSQKKIKITKITKQ